MSQEALCYVVQLIQNIEVERNHYGKNAEEKPAKCEKVNVKKNLKRKLYKN